MAIPGAQPKLAQLVSLAGKRPGRQPGRIVLTIGLVTSSLCVV
jgi:hypothetical protein